MPTVEGQTPPPLIHRGWKEIAARLRVSVRTAQRYAAERHLPVTKDGDYSQSPVWAYERDLECWLESCRGGSSAIGQSVLTYVWASVAVVAGVGVLFWGRDVASQVDRGFVAFNSVRTGDPDIYVIRDDGTGERRLTSDSGWDTRPAISPDGHQVAFSSNRSGHADLWLINIDGTGLRRVGIGQEGSRCSLAGLDWSPDGKRIAFANRQHDVQAVYEIELHSRQVRRVSDLNEDASQPRYDTDGITIYATRGRPYDGHTSRVEAIRSRTDRPHRISPMEDASFPTQVFLGGQPQLLYKLRMTKGISRLLLQYSDGRVEPLEPFDGWSFAAVAGPRGPGALKLSGIFLIVVEGNIYRSSLDGRLAPVTTLGGGEPSWWVPEQPKVPEFGPPAGVLVPDPAARVTAGCGDQPEGLTVLKENGFRYFLFWEPADGDPHIHVALEPIEDPNRSAGDLRIMLARPKVENPKGFSPEQVRHILKTVNAEHQLFARAWRELVVNRSLTLTSGSKAAAKTQ